jgi:single-strand DNA-binding protein
MLNVCNFIGNVGADPEIRSTQNGGKIANLRLAVSEKWKDRNGERQEKTEWVSVVVFSDGLVGVIERYISKGSKLFVSGKMQTRKWTDQNGNDRYSTEIVLQGFDAKLVMLDGPKQQGGNQSRGGGSMQGSGFDDQRGRASSRSSFDDDLDDSIPFLSATGIY